MGWRMSCDVGEVTERLENELWFGKATGGLENELWRRWIAHVIIVISIIIIIIIIIIK